MASEKIDALELNINAKLTTENLDKLITALGKLSKALDQVNAKRVNTEIKEVGNSSATAAAKADTLTTSFWNQTIRITALITIYRRLSDVISDNVADSVSYIKTLNMFNVSLGEYADNASKYGQTVRDAFGIDIAGWQKAQGIFETLIEGFGVGGDQAAYMSQQLTQLSYDIASYYDLTTEEAQNKIKAALSGRIEPIRKLGWDISQGKLVDIASNPENYGITTYSINEETGAIEANTQAIDDNTEHQIVNFNQLTQAEKVQLRYIALMTEVTEVQGNFGRTLHDPANQLIIFREQLSMTGRAFGNIFIPAINEVLPYLTAFARVLEETFQKIANFLGFEIPDMSDRIGIANEVDYYDDVVEATGSAAKNAKKLKDYMIGIDELNVLRPDDTGASGGGSSGGNQSDISGLLMPGYDFLSSAIENRVKEIKEAFDELGKDFKEHPLQVTGKIIWEGAGTIGQKFWEWYLGKTPEELAEEANTYFGGSLAAAFTYELAMNSPAAKVGFEFWTWMLGMTPEELAEEAARNGNTIGEQFVIAYSNAIQNSVFGEFGEFVVQYVLMGGKSPEEFYSDAKRSGQSFGTAFLTGMVVNSTIPSSIGGMISFWEVITGKDTNLASRAAEAGRTVGEQFTAEVGRQLLELVASNPVFEWIYNTSTGRDAQRDLKDLDKKLNGTSGKRYNPGVKPEGNSGTRQKGKSAAEGYIEGWKSKLSDIKETGKAIYDRIFKGINNDGYATASIYESGANLSISYADGLQSGKYEVSNAGQELFTSGYNGANDNGQGAQKYGDIAEGMSYLFAGALGSKVSKDRAYDAGYSMANEGSWGAYDLQDDYEWTGDQAGRGYILGIMAHKLEAEQAGKSVANATLANLKEALGIASPSKEAYEAGKYFVEGYTNAIKDFSVKATEAANDMAEKSVKAAKISDSMFGGYSIPTSNNAGYKVGAINENSMAAFASSLYQAVVSGMSTVDLGKGDTKVIIDGKEIFTVVQSEGRKRGVAISNGAFST